MNQYKEKAFNRLKLSKRVKKELSKIESGQFFIIFFEVAVNK